MSCENRWTKQKCKNSTCKQLGQPETSDLITISTCIVHKIILKWTLHRLQQLTRVWMLTERPHASVQASAGNVRFVLGNRAACPSIVVHGYNLSPVRRTRPERMHHVTSCRHWIECLWAEVERAVCKNQIIATWYNIPAQCIQHVGQSTLRWIQAVPMTKGETTWY